MDTAPARTTLWKNGLSYAGDPIGTDSLALGAFAARCGARQGCDLGCGSGILMLLLAWGDRSLAMEGVELRPRAAAACEENIAANGFSDRCHVRQGDLRRSDLTLGSMDLVVSNPPYFPAGAGQVSPDPDRAAMRTESATLPELCRAAGELLRPGGAFCLVHRTDRMGEVFAAMPAGGLEVKRLRLVAADPGSAPTLFLCEARRGAKPGIIMEPVLFQRGTDGRETAEYRALCHWEG